MKFNAYVIDTRAQVFEAEIFTRVPEGKLSEVFQRARRLYILELGLVSERKQLDGTHQSLEAQKNHNTLQDGPHCCNRLLD